MPPQGAPPEDGEDDDDFVMRPPFGRARKGRTNQPQQVQTKKRQASVPAEQLKTAQLQAASQYVAPARPPPAVDGHGSTCWQGQVSVGKAARSLTLPMSDAKASRIALPMQHHHQGGVPSRLTSPSTKQPTCTSQDIVLNSKGQPLCGRSSVASALEHGGLQHKHVDLMTGTDLVNSTSFSCGIALSEDSEPDEACCPICCCSLALISDTEAGRTAHVNGCLDANMQTQACPSDDADNEASEVNDFEECQCSDGVDAESCDRGVPGSYDTCLKGAGGLPAAEPQVQAALEELPGLSPHQVGKWLRSNRPRPDAPADTPGLDSGEYCRQPPGTLSQPLSQPPATEEQNTAAAVAKLLHGECCTGLGWGDQGHVQGYHQGQKHKQCCDQERQVQQSRQQTLFCEGEQPQQHTQRQEGCRQVQQQGSNAEKQESVAPPRELFSMSSWLEQHGLQCYAAALASEEVDEAVLPLLDAPDLEVLGVVDADEVERFLAAICTLPAANAGGHCTSLSDVACVSGTGANCGHAVAVAQQQQQCQHKQQQLRHGRHSSSHLHQHPYHPGDHGGAHQEPPPTAVCRDPAHPISRGPLQTGSSAFSSMFNQRDRTPAKITKFLAGGGDHGKENVAPPPATDAQGRGMTTLTPPPALQSWQQQQRQVQPQSLPRMQHLPAGSTLSAVTATARVSSTAAGVGGRAASGRPAAYASATYRSSLHYSVPRWHTIPGTKFVVDKFGPSVAGIRDCSYWFLTHFHADHYMGLNRRFNQGWVVCNPVTAQLLSTKIKVPWAKLLVIPMNTPTVVDGVTITLIDANHCPGAAMIVAEPPRGPPVLHTGDCRLLPDMQQCPALCRIRGKAILVLDTTYCEPQYCFPSQADTLQFALQSAKAEVSNPRALLLFGTYTIGKERLFLEVAKALGRKVYVSSEKMAVLKCCNLAPDYEKLLTTNHLETNLHAVPLFKVSLQGMGEILKQYKGRYNTIVGFQPTGWTHGKEKRRGQCGNRVQRGLMVLYQVPYSEHSSFAELCQFVSWFQPTELLPSVGNDCGGLKAQRMVSLLTQGQSGPLGAQAVAAAGAGTGSIARYFMSKPSNGRGQGMAGAV